MASWRRPEGLGGGTETVALLVLVVAGELLASLLLGLPALDTGGPGDSELFLVVLDALGGIGELFLVVLDTC